MKVYYSVHLFYDWWYNPDMFEGYLKFQKVPYIQLVMHQFCLFIYFDRYSRARSFKENFSDLSDFGLRMGELSLVITS